MSEIKEACGVVGMYDPDGENVATSAFTRIWDMCAIPPQELPWRRMPSHWCFLISRARW